MYKFESGQVSIHEFRQPIGMTLHEDNRWVKKTQTIPWNAIERRYAQLFTNNKGNVAKPLQLGLDACIFQVEYGFPDVELTRTMQEHPYFQYFCGYKAYDGGNGGTMIVDATCAPAQIKYPPLLAAATTTAISPPPPAT